MNARMNARMEDRRAPSSLALLPRIGAGALVIASASIAIVTTNTAVTTNTVTAGTAAAAVTVAIDAGMLEGTTFGALNEVAFLGIPYAAPPVGALRWRPPQPVAAWTGTRQATRLPPACPQLPSSWLPKVDWSEDCLFANVWTTNVSAGAKQPVIVWLHGGSNRAGYSHYTPLGPALSRQGVVFVSAGYRLGALGFLAHPALSAESPQRSSGNYGLLDQVQALAWVRANIGRFGGDPAQVTVMGQSAGAGDICLLMASPLAKGLFQRAILQSGECQSELMQDIRGSLPGRALETSGEALGARLVQALGIASGGDSAPATAAVDATAAARDLLRKLRQLPAEAILKAVSQPPLAQVRFDAIVDGWVIPEQPAQTFGGARQLAIPILIGSNADEATIFANRGGPSTVDAWQQYLRDELGARADQALRAYPAASDGEAAAQFLQFHHDRFRHGAWSMARRVTRAGQPAYLYHFAYADTGTRAPLKAFHGEELYFLSDTFPADWIRGRDDERLAAQMRTYWTQFAKTGNPNVAGGTRAAHAAVAHTNTDAGAIPRGLPEWPAYDERPDEWLELDREVRLRPVEPRLRVLDAIARQRLDAWRASTRSSAAAASPGRSPGRSAGRSPGRSPTRSQASPPARSPGPSPGSSPAGSPGRSPDRR